MTLEQHLNEVRKQIRKGNIPSVSFERVPRMGKGNKAALKAMENPLNKHIKKGMYVVGKSVNHRGKALSRRKKPRMRIQKARQMVSTMYMAKQAWLLENGQ